MKARRRSAGAALVALTSLSLLNACAGETICSCLGFDGLFVRVHGAAVGEQVQVCAGDICAVATVDQLSDLADYAEVRIPASALGAWSADRKLEVAFRITANGKDVDSFERVAPKKHNCCGDYWQVDASG